MRVLVIGGAGTVGSLVLPALLSACDVTVADLHPQTDPAFPFRTVNVTDYESLIEACAGQDALVYLAMGTKRGWGEPRWAAAQFDINCKGLYLTLRAAAEQGVRRVVYASTGSIFDPYCGRLVTDEPDAVDAYGLSKHLGEVVCRAAVREHGLDIVALRLIGPMTDQDWTAYNGERAEVMTAASDVASAFLAALRAPIEGFAAAFVSGDHEQVYIDLGPSRALLGWEPKARRA
jgi:nucleoside-diphosphate-sugar epimerase